MKINITCYFANSSDLQEWIQAQQAQLTSNLPKLSFTLDAINNFSARLILKPGKVYRTSVVSTKLGDTTIMFTDVETNETYILTYTMFDIGYTNWSINVYE